MSTEGGTKAVVAALLANLGIAVTKFVAFFLTGFSSMLAEAIHSVADSGNQGLLLLGGRRSRKEATEEHPFGYGRERYIYSFIVAIVLFSAIFFLSFVYEVAKGGLEWGPLHRARRLISGVPTDRTTESTIRRVGLEGRDEAA